MCLVGDGFKIAVNCAQAVPARFPAGGIPLSRLLDAPTFPHFQVLASWVLKLSHMSFYRAGSSGAEVQDAQDL